MNISQATPADFVNIVALVNAAYRGEDSKQGWTTEADLLLGDKRTDEATLLAECQQPGTTILQLKDETSALLGCVLLRHSPAGMYLGMLSVWPGMQAKGVGKWLMQGAETHAQQLHCRRIYLTVISARTELIAWYQRRGYQLTGESKPFPDQPEFGVATQPLEFVVMEKWLHP